MNNAINLISIGAKGSEFKIENTKTQGSFILGADVKVAKKRASGETGRQFCDIFSGIGAQTDVLLDNEVVESKVTPSYQNLKLRTTPYRVIFSRKTMLPYIRPIEDGIGSDRVALLRIGCYDKFISGYFCHTTDILQYAFDVDSRDVHIIVRFKSPGSKFRLSLTSRDKKITTNIEVIFVKTGEEVIVCQEDHVMDEMEKPLAKRIKLRKYVPTIVPALVLSDGSMKHQKFIKGTPDLIHNSTKVAVVTKKNIIKTIQMFRREGFKSCALVGLEPALQRKVVANMHIVFNVVPKNGSYALEPISK